jgi:hypothetical protein
VRNIENNLRANTCVVQSRVLPFDFCKSSVSRAVGFLNLRVLCYTPSAMRWRPDWRSSVGASAFFGQLGQELLCLLPAPAL